MVLILMKTVFASGYGCGSKSGCSLTSSCGLTSGCSLTSGCKVICSEELLTVDLEETGVEEPEDEEKERGVEDEERGVEDEEREDNEFSVKSDTADEGRDELRFNPVRYPGSEIVLSEFALLPTDEFVLLPTDEFVLLPTEPFDLLPTDEPGLLTFFAVVKFSSVFAPNITLFSVFIFSVFGGIIIFKYINNLYIKNLTNTEYS
jgi:hypothetical protein